MFDLPDNFWNILAFVIFAIVNLILWIHFRRCKQKGIKPKPAFAKFKKHEKKISRTADIFIIVIILLTVLICAYFILSDLIEILTESNPTAKTARLQNSLASYLLILMYHSVLIALLIGFLTPFQKNITVLKRGILLAICCVPFNYGLLYYTLDNHQDFQFHIKLLGSLLFPILFINSPPIILGKPFSEFFPKLLQKLPLPYFQIPENIDNQSKAIKSPEKEKENIR